MVEHPIQSNTYATTYLSHPYKLSPLHFYVNLYYDTSGWQCLQYHDPISCTWSRVDICLCCLRCWAPRNQLDSHNNPIKYRYSLYFTTETVGCGEHHNYSATSTGPLWKNVSLHFYSPALTVLPLSSQGHLLQWKLTTAHTRLFPANDGRRFDSPVGEEERKLTHEFQESCLGGWGCGEDTTMRETSLLLCPDMIGILIWGSKMVGQDGKLKGYEVTTNVYKPPSGKKRWNSPITEFLVR